MASEPDRFAVCPICDRVFVVNPRHSISKSGRIYVFGHLKPNGELCGCNGAKIPSFKARKGDYIVEG